MKVVDKMFVLSELVEKIAKNGNAKIYIRKNPLNYICIVFKIINGNLNIVSKEYKFDKPLFLNNEFDRSAKIVKTIEKLQYTDDINITSLLDGITKNYGLANVLPQIFLESYNEKNIGIISSGGSFSDDNDKVAKYLFEKIMQMLRLSENDLVGLILLPNLEKKKLLISKMFMNCKYNYPDGEYSKIIEDKMLNIYDHCMHAIDIIEKVKFAKSKDEYLKYLPEYEELCNNFSLILNSREEETPKI